MSNINTNLEERRVSVSFGGSSKPTEDKNATKSTTKGSVSKQGGKTSKAKGKKGAQSPSRSPKGSFGERRGSRRGSMKTKKAAEDVAAKELKRGRSDSLFKKSDVRYKEIRRALTKRQRDQKKNADSGEKQTQEL